MVLGTLRGVIPAVSPHASFAPPSAQHLRRSPVVCIAKDVGMPQDHLPADLFNHLGHAELALFLCDLALKDDLEEKSPSSSFTASGFFSSIASGLHMLLNDKRFKGLHSLLSVPGQPFSPLRAAMIFISSSSP